MDQRIAIILRCIGDVSCYDLLVPQISHENVQNGARKCKSARHAMRKVQEEKTEECSRVRNLKMTCYYVAPSCPHSSVRNRRLERTMRN